MIYLNNASTTKPTKEVIQDFMWCAENYWANPSDISTEGIKAKQIIANAQEQVANYIGAKPNEIVFTSGASESNNWAIKGFMEANKNYDCIITTLIEHPSVYNTCLHLCETSGYKIAFAPLDNTGMVNVNKFEELIEKLSTSHKCLVSIMLANNEFGTINKIKEIADIVRKHQCYLHVDAVQAFSQIPINVKEMGIDMMSVSFHKFGGFKSCGFLYIRDGIALSSLIHGGHQFDGRRAGTENVPMIYALGNQLERLSKKDYPSSEIRIYLYNKICETCNKIKIDVQLNGDLIDRLPNNISLTFKGINAETLITLLDMRDIQVSVGSACSSGTKEPSRVLKAIGLSDKEAYSTVRISLCADTTYEECDEFVDILGQCLTSLKMIY